jgi:hypothetical protein
LLQQQLNLNLYNGNNQLIVYIIRKYISIVV